MAMAKACWLPGGHGLRATNCGRSERSAQLAPQHWRWHQGMHSLNFLFLYSLCLFSTSRAQSISTSTPVPPLQWINLTSLLQGSSAPPLKDASIGYDNATRTLIIFGGESQGGLPQQQTYLSVFPFLLLITSLSINSAQS